MPFRLDGRAVTDARGPTGATRTEASGIQARSRRQGVWLLVAVACVNLILVAFRSDVPDWRIPAAGSAILWLSAYPLWRLVRRRERESLFLALYCGVYFLAYGFPALGGLPEVRLQTMSSEATLAAVVIALLGESLFLGAYFGTPVALLHWVPPLKLRLDLLSSQRRLGVGMVTFTIVAVSRFFVEVPDDLGQVVRVLASLGVVSASGLFLAWLRGQLPLTRKVLLVVCMAVQIYLQFGTGSLAAPVSTAAVFLFVFIWETGRFPFGVLLAGTLLLIPLNSAKMAFREQTWESGSPTNPATLGLRFAEILWKGASSGEIEMESASAGVSSRLDHLGTLAYVMESTPSAVPYWSGETYAGAAWMFVPRVLYPDKPRQTYGQDFGHRYDLLDPTDYLTSYNFEQLVEMYANFGVTGCLAGMALIGLLYRALTRLVPVAGAGEGGVVIMANLFMGLIQLESNFVLVHGLILQSAVIQYFFLRAIGSRRPASPRALSLAPP